MRSSSKKLLTAAIAATASVALYDSASAYSQFPYVEQMGGDHDTYTPTDLNMFDDAGYPNSLPPGFISANPPVDFDSDWDIRRFGNEQNTQSIPGARGGDIEEAPSGFQGVNTGDGSQHIGYHQFGDLGSHYAYRNGAFSRAARSFSEVGDNFWATDDIYIDPAAVAGGFWLNSAVNGQFGYITEDSWRVQATPAGWNVFAGGATTVLIGTIPNGQWTRWETHPISLNAGGLIGFDHRIYGLDTNGDYTVLLGSGITADYAGGANGTFNDIVGPRWQWFLSGSPTFPDHLFVDNTGWTDGSVDIGAADVPEPATVTLLTAAGGLLAMRRRRR